MIEVAIKIPANIKDGVVTKTIEQVCNDNNLICSLKGTLTTYPDCIHWHFKKDKQKGVLEITWWEREHRLWFKVADHRTNIWIEEILPKLKKKIEQALHKK